MDNKKICRLCLTENLTILHNVFSISVENENFNDVIQLHFDLEVKEEDEIKEICTECFDRIREFHAYYQKVLENQKQLLSSISTVRKTSNEKQNFEKLDEILSIEDVDVVPVSRPSTPMTEFPNPEIVKIEPDISECFYNETENTVFISELPTISSSLQDENDEMKSIEGIVTQNQVSQATGVSVKTKMTRSRNSNKNLHDVDKNKADDDDDEDDCEEPPTLNKQNTAKRKTENFKYPKIIIENSKFIITGKRLLYLLERFYVLNCDLCTKDNRFKSIDTLFLHYHEHHNVRPYVKCCEDEKFHTRQSMAYHMARHLQPDAFTCPICGKMVLRPQNLKGHIEHHLPQEQRSYSCMKCPKKFGHLSALAAHQLVHKAKPKRLCNDCGEGFDTELQLKKHLHVVHSKEFKEYMCDICGKKFNSSGNLSDHIKTHSNIRLIQCEICHKWFKNKTNFRLHMMNLHSNTQHKCDQCDLTTNNLRILRYHIKTKHLKKSDTDESRFICTFCEKKFKSKSILKYHLTQHTGIPNYSCEFCRKQFASNGNYYTHRKRMHSNELKELKTKQEEEARIMREKAIKEQSSKLKIK